MSTTTTSTLTTTEATPPTSATPPKEPSARHPHLPAVAGVVLLVLGLAAFAVYWFGWFGNGAAELRLAGVVEIQETRLGSKVGGRVAEVLVREGDRVSPGTPLVRLEMPELKAQREQLLARLASARAEKQKVYDGARPQEKDEAKAAWEAARARLEVARKPWREEEIAQARFDLESAEADLQQTMREYARVEGILGQGTTASDLEQARAARDRAAARHSVARSRLAMTTRGGRAIEIAQAEQEAARLEARWRLLEDGSRKEDKDIAAAQVSLLEAQVQELDARLAEATIATVEPCLVEVLGVRPGDLLAPNQPAVRVLRADDLWVRVYVPEPELGKVRLGQPASVKLDAYPDVSFGGEVVQIASISEFTPRNVQSADQRKHQVFGVKVRVADPKGIFKSGLAAQVVLPLYGADQ